LGKRVRELRAAKKWSQEELTHIIIRSTPLFVGPNFGTSIHLPSARPWRHASSHGEQNAFHNRPTPGGNVAECGNAEAADVIGLYLNPPQQAAFFCVDDLGFGDNATQLSSEDRQQQAA
jgi:hypothetical protein